ncbi:glycosyltransferase family protein [Luteimonas salinilitoris]|uniref:Methyltransferase domain-containing protein n=1 Tax=Luteimonas salinilitoris TaxID=3237697 RepID=A0ABV4HSR5_9GAMM
MRWIIKCPAPTDSRQQKWGDFHFARSLRKQLARHGYDVLIQYEPEWSDGDDDADVILVVRGKYRYAPRNRDALHVAWNLSHPEDVGAEEIRDYDVFAVASESHARELAQLHGRERVIPLLQCTDAEEFNLSLSLPARDRRDAIFVGNSRNVERWCVIEWLRQGYPLKIWGRGWSAWPEASRRVVSDYIENEQLGRTYGAARVSLNDHWPDMRNHGFINNRIYDVLACGLPVISDRHPELVRRFGDTIIYYDAGTSLQAAVDRYVHEYPRVFDMVQREAEQVRVRDSFEARADELADIVEARIQARGGKVVPRPRPPVRIPVKAAEPAPPAPPLPGPARVHMAAGNADAERSSAETEVHVTVAEGYPGVPGCYCPVCETAVEDFIAGGVVVKRKRARCPNCGVLERHRLMALYLRSDTPLFDGRPRRLLHVAPEPPIAGILSKLENVSYLSADLCSEHVMVKMDLTDIQYPDESFDAIVCSHVLEHIPDDAKAMREMFRILTPGGIAVIQVPVYGETTYEDFSITSEEGRLAAFGQRDHVRKYGRDIAERLAGAGLRVRTFVPPLDPDLRRRLGLKPSPIFDCRKA